MGAGQPGGAGVVEFGQGAIAQLFFVAGFGDDTVGVGRGGHAQRHDFGQPLRPVRRVQPVVAQGGEFVGGFELRKKNCTYILVRYGTHSVN